MKIFKTDMKKNTLPVALIFSVLLHATGFYIFSDIPFNLPSRSSDPVPIKITAFFKEKRIHSASVKHSTKQNKKLTTHTPKLISTEFKEIKPKKPTPIYRNNYLFSLSQKDSKKRIPVAVNRRQFTSRHKQSSSRISSQSFFRNKVSIIEPRFFAKDYDTQGNTIYSPKPTKYIETSQKIILSETVRSRSHSNLQKGSSQDFNPVFMYKSDINKNNVGFLPNARKISHTNGFGEKSISSAKTTTIVKATPPSMNSSSLDLGELRRGFHKKVWQKVAEAKYYPRIARERGFEGEPIVTFTLGRKGELINLRLIEFSSYKLLNEAALETVRRGIPYPSIPKPLGKDSISFNLPISYVLK